jgi:hypothetical protein
MNPIIRVLSAAAIGLAFGCSQTSSDFIPSGGSTGGTSSNGCSAPSCGSCASCFELCVCQTGQSKACAHACSKAPGSGGASSGGASAGGFGGLGSGGAGSSAGSGGTPGFGGASSGGSSSGGASNGGDCCAPTGAPGCSDPSVESCVCASDSYCCDTEWDDICAGEVDSLGCGTCSSGGGGSGGSSGGGGASGGGGTSGSGGASGGGGTGGFAPGAVSWLAFPEQNTQSNPTWSTYMTDVIRHLPSSYGNQYYDSDKVTYVHETTHGINAHLRNYFNNTGKNANAFYVGNDQAAIVVEPAILKTDANPYVPQSLRESRYDTYLVGATDWNDTPLYLFDEWVAYTNGTEAAVNLSDEGKWTDGWRDTFGSLEFTVYAFALGMAVQAGDPSYFSSYSQFREFLKWNAERAMALYAAARTRPEFQWDLADNYYQTLQTSPDAANLRNFVKSTYGDPWAQSVMGF